MSVGQIFRDAGAEVSVATGEGDEDLAMAITASTDLPPVGRSLPAVLVGDPVHVTVEEGGFDRATVRFRVDPERLPAGQGMDDVFVARFDEELGVWLPLPSEVGADGTVSGVTERFSDVAPLGIDPGLVEEAIRAATTRLGDLWLDDARARLLAEPPVVDCQLPDLRLQVRAADPLSTRYGPRLDGCPIVQDVRTAREDGQDRYTVRLVNRAAYPVLITLPGLIVAKPAVFEPVHLLRQTLWGLLDMTYVPALTTWEVTLGPESVGGSASAQMDPGAVLVDALLEAASNALPAFKTRSVEVAAEVTEVALDIQKIIRGAGGFAVLTDSIRMQQIRLHIRTETTSPGSEQFLENMLYILDAATCFGRIIQSAQQGVASPREALNGIQTCLKNVLADLDLDVVGNMAGNILLGSLSVVSEAFFAVKDYLTGLAAGQPLPGTLPLATLAFEQTDPFDRLDEALGLRGVGPFAPADELSRGPFRDEAGQLNMAFVGAPPPLGPAPATGSVCAAVDDPDAVILPDIWSGSYQVTGHTGSDVDPDRTLQVEVARLDDATGPTLRQRLADPAGCDDDPGPLRRTTGLLDDFGEISLTSFVADDPVNGEGHHLRAISGDLYVHVAVPDGVAGAAMPSVAGSDVLATSVTTVLCRLDHLYGTAFVTQDADRVCDALVRPGEWAGTDWRAPDTYQRPPPCPGGAACTEHVGDLDGDGITDRLASYEMPGGDRGLSLVASGGAGGDGRSELAYRELEVPGNWYPAPPTVVDAHLLGVGHVDDLPGEDILVGLTTGGGTYWSHARLLRGRNGLEPVDLPYEQDNWVTLQRVDEHLSYAGFSCPDTDGDGTPELVTWTFYADIDASAPLAWNAEEITYRWQDGQPVEIGSRTITHITPGGVQRPHEAVDYIGIQCPGFTD